MKKVIVLIIGCAFSLIISSCSSGHVANEPTYVEVARPIRPSPNHVWINGDWHYRKNTYIHDNGYWEKPRKGKTYQQGYWKKGKKGNHWTNGRWKK